MQFYVGDWRRDPNVRLLSAEARGVWFELLCVMHEHDTHEVTGTPRSLAKMTGLDDDETERGIDQIERFDIADVTRCNGAVTLVSRRRQRDAEQREQGAERVRRYRERKKEEDSNEDVTHTHARARSDSDIDSSLKEGEESVRGEGFDEAWDAYAKKQAKASARRAWRRLSRKDRAAALEAIPAYVKATPDPQYRAHFATWINGRRWEDELPTNGHVPKLSTPAACSGCGKPLGVDFSKYQGRAYCDECFGARVWAKPVGAHA